MSDGNGRWGMKERSKNIFRVMGFLAAGVVFPGVMSIFDLEAVFLTMCLPVLAAGFLMPMQWAVFISVALPVLNGVLFGYPPLLPSLPLAVCRMIALAAFANLLFEGMGWKIYPALLVALGMGIVVLFCAAAILGAVAEDFRGSAYTLEAVKTGWPGLLLQIAAVPPIVKGLIKRRGIGKGNRP